MNRADLAKDKLRCWSLIGRARKVGFSVPEKWLRYGEPATGIALISTVMDTLDMRSRVHRILNQDCVLYTALKEKSNGQA